MEPSAADATLVARNGVDSLYGTHGWWLLGSGCGAAIGSATAFMLVRGCCQHQN